MERRFHFISGLPRSGSTLLSAILRQNPRFQAGISSPVAALFQAALRTMSAGSEHAAQMDEAQREAVLRGLFTSYHASVTDRPVVFDSSRNWTARLPALRRLFPDSRMICTVRDMPWIMDSIERLYRANPFENTRLWGDDVERNTVYSRVETLAQRDRLVGFAWTALREAFFGEDADRMLVVDYDALTHAPHRVIGRVYEFLGEEPFEHDFSNVSFDAPAFDQALGVSGLHRVRSQVAPQQRQTVLPPDLFDKFKDLNFWRDPRGSAAHVLGAQAAPKGKGAPNGWSPSAVHLPDLAVGEQPWV